MHVAIFALFLATTAVTTALEPPESYVEHQLRGANTDRDLLSMSGGATSLSYSIAAAAGADQFCFDYGAVCLEFGDLFSVSYTDAFTEGNAFAIAWADEYLWLHATCGAYAEAYARACAFTKVDGKINVNTSTTGTKKNISLSVQLKTATMTFALAQSVAMAQAYANVGAMSFTSVQAFCSQVGNMSILCAGGTASTDLFQLATANANAFGSAGALASSGANTDTNALVSADGTAISNVNGVITAKAWSWAVAQAGAAASAIANAFTIASNDSFAAVCVAQYADICGNRDNADKGFCALDRDVACAQAWAAGQAYASALSMACAEEFINAWAGVSTFVSLSANVNCMSTPKLSWTTANAGVGMSCGVGV
jgi:hypothetical protein